MMMDLEGENEVIETADEETMDEEVEHDSSGIANADKIREGRVVEQTRKSYQRVFRYITNYFKEKAPIAVIGDELILPIADQHLKMFLGDMGADRSDGTVKAKSTMTMYVSVIKFYYRENGIRMSDHMQTYCEDFMQGYRRGIARKKETGIMKNFEGKVPVSSNDLQLSFSTRFICKQRSFSSQLDGPPIYDFVLESLRSVCVCKGLENVSLQLGERLFSDRHVTHEERSSRREGNTEAHIR